MSQLICSRAYGCNECHAELCSKANFEEYFSSADLFPVVRPSCFTQTNFREDRSSKRFLLRARDAAMMGPRKTGRRTAAKMLTRAHKIHKINISNIHSLVLRSFQISTAGVSSLSKSKMIFFNKIKKKLL